MKAAVVIGILLPLNLLAQVHSAIEKYNTDSLELLIPQRQGVELVDVYNQLATSYSYDAPSLCEKYASQALSLARELNYKKGIGDAERYTGLMHMYAGRYPETVVHFYNALENYEKAGDIYSLAKLYFDFARLNFYTDNYLKTEEFGNKALELYEQIKTDGTTTGTLKDIARAKSAFGLLYRTTNRSDKAKEIYQWYNRIMREEKFEITDQMVHTQILARCFDETGEPDSALWYFNKTLDFPEVNNSIKALKMESCKSMGMIYYKMRKNREAEMYFEQVARVMDKTGFLQHTFISNLMLGNIYFEEGKIRQAEEYYTKAISVSREMIQKQSWYRYDSLKYIISYGAELYFPWPENLLKIMIWEFQARIMARLFELSMRKGDWQNSTKYMVSLSEAKDTLNSLQRNRDLIEMQTKYETGRKEDQIRKLAEENKYKQLRLNNSRIILAGMGVMMLFLIIIGILLIHQSRIKTRHRMIILEQKLLRSQMNPHFIFNSMASIQDFILAKDARSAANYLSRFARLIRNILDSSLEESIPVAREMETIEYYLQLQKVRLEEKFDFIITRDESVEDDEIRIPALLIQPFVENAIEHGIRHKSEKGMISVVFQRQDHWLSVTVEDNGVGRAKALEFEETRKKDHTSVSTYLIRERLKILNKKSSRKITLDIIDLFNDSDVPAGTKVVIRVPV